MARKSTKTTKPVQTEEEEKSGSLFDYLRFGESYTSLILGIIVVIISTVLLLSFVNNKNANNDAQQLLSQKDIALPSSPLTTETPAANNVNPTNTPVPTTAPAVTQKPATPAPTKAPAATQKPATPTPTKKAEPTKPAAKPTAKSTAAPAKGEYIVVAGDNLWIIAEKEYKSGYNWVDIARANNLPNPGMISVGQKLKLPKVDQKIATVKPETKPAAQPDTNKISGDTYKVVKGDTLWTISVRAYGNGYQYAKIASANKLNNPSLIHSGNTLKIPRN